MILSRSLRVAFLVSVIGLMATREELASQEAPPRENSLTSHLAQQLSEVDLELQKIEQIRHTAADRLAETKAQMEDFQNKRVELLKQQNDLGVSSASYDDIMRLLQTQKVQLTIDLAGIEARRDAMIEQYEANRKVEIENGGTAVESLKELMAIQADRLRQAEAMHDKGVAPQAEVLDAKQKLLEVKIRLEEMNRVYGNGQKPVNQELLSVSLTRAETVARLNKVNQLLEEYVHARTPIDSLSRVAAEIDAFESTFSRLRDEVAVHEDQLNIIGMRKHLLQEQLKRAQGNKGDDQD